MRLRLSIRRNGLPDTNIIWSIDKASSTTIYQLLEQVNEVVPIESDDKWGLEDYAVEIKGEKDLNYECLHFQYVTSVLKEDDEVIIRCLLSNDIRTRRASGRTQITVDGKRLLDGVPWGRPLLRTVSNRPTIKIRSRNTRDIAYSNYEEIDDIYKDEESLSPKDNLSGQVILKSDVDNYYDSEEDEEDDDYVPEESMIEGHQGSESDCSNRGLQNENLKTQTHGSKELSPKDNRKCLGQRFSSLNEISDRKIQIRLLYSAFPTSSLAICKYVIDGTNGDMNEAWEALSIGFSASKSQDEIIRLASKNCRKLICREKGSKYVLSLNNSHCQNLQDKISKKKPSSSRNKKYILETHDQNRFPHGSVVTAKSLASKEVKGQKNDNFSDFEKCSTKLSRKSNPLPSLKTTESSKKINSHNQQIKKNLSLNEACISENYSHAASSSVSSDTSKSQTDMSSDSSNSIDNSSSESSDEEVPDESSGKSKVMSNDTTTNSKSTQPATRLLVVPGKGKRATQMRNKRRRISNAMKRLKEKGIIPADISKDDFMEIYEKQRPFHVAEQICTSNKSNLVCNKSQIKVNGDEEFKRRRKELLDSLASGGIDVRSDLPRHEISPSSNAQLNTSGIVPESIAAKTGLSEIDVKIVSITPRSSELATSVTPPDTESSKKELRKENQKPSQRSKLNLDAGKRMLFRAIGIKPPVTKQDEDNIRKEIMRDSNSFILKKEISTETNDLELKVEDSEAWKEKIVYRAKECVEKNVELSEPPFPFFQRWDPQQQTKKRKSNHQIQTQNGLDYDHVTKKQKKDQENITYSNEQELHKDLCKSDQLNLQKDVEPQQRLKFDSIVKKSLDDCVIQMENEDLIPLPDDPSSLPDLKEGETKTGMLILFKQLEVSAASRWQPQVSSYRRATVLSVENDRIQVKLAQLDLQTHEKLYDEQGQRIYHGFETIEIDETEDDGLRDLHFNELIQPKILNLVEEDPPKSQPNLSQCNGIKSANS